MIISPAYAQSGGGSAGFLTQLLPFVLIFVVFYFFLIRPQQQRAKRHKQMVEALRRGDKVVTAGGFKGVVTKATAGQDSVEVEIAPDVKVAVVRSMISSVEVRDDNSKGNSGAKDNSGSNSNVKTVSRRSSSKKASDK